jgi:hypothetical protein
MPITFQCTCGRKFRTPDENAGRTATCPDCRNKLIVPAASVPAAAPAAPPAVLPPPLPDEDPAAVADGAYNVQSEEVKPVARRSAPSSPYGWDRRYDPGEADDDRRRGRDRDGDYPRGRRTYYDRDDIRDRIIRRAPSPASNPWTDGGVLKGLGLMGLGALITVGGLAVGWLVFPGPILFIYGLICLIRGIGSGKM